MTTTTAQPFTRDQVRESSKPKSRADAFFEFGDVGVVRQLKICFAWILTVTVLIGGVGFFGMAKVSDDWAKGSRLVEATMIASQINSDIAQARFHTERYKASGNAAALTEARRYVEAIRRDALNAAAMPQFTIPERTSQLGALNQALERFDSNLITLEANRENAGGIARSGDELAQRSQSIKGSFRQDLKTIRTEVDDFMYWNRFAILGLVVAWITAAMAVAKRLGPDISNRIKNMTIAMRRLADGDKDLVVHDLDRTDEFGDMARSLETFRRGYLKLDRLRTEQAEQQHEKEELRAQQESMLLELAEKFERTVGEVVGGVAAASTQLQLTASSMAAAAEQSAHQTSEVSNALSEASGGVTAAAAASDEFAMSIGEISRQAATSAELARNATIATASADATISALSDSAQQVGQIVELISTIAQRTNLLALNASIEAARGGEAGRGFAVVASEVKELAAQTSKATDAVAQQIKAIQESTGASVTALKAIGQQVQQLEATSVSIAAAVDQQSVAGQDLARSIDLAARSTDEVTSNIVHVRETSAATGAAASEVLTSSTELEQQAATLTAQVHDFLSHVRAA